MNKSSVTKVVLLDTFKIFHTFAAKLSRIYIRVPFKKFKDVVFN